MVHDSFQASEQQIGGLTLSLAQEALLIKRKGVSVLLPLSRLIHSQLARL